MRSLEVKRTLLIAVAIALAVISAGCADKNYAAQKFAYKYDTAFERIAAAPGQFSRAEFEDAIQGYKKLIERYPDWGGLAERRLRIGQLYYAMAKFPEARAAFHEVLAKHADDPRIAVRALSLIADCYEREGDWNQAELEYRRLVENYGKMDLNAAIAVLSKIASHYVEQNDLEKAKAAYDEALALISSLREVVTDVAALGALDRVTADIEVAKAALAGDLKLGLDGLIDVAEKYRGQPAGMNALARLGVIYWRMNDNERALATFDQFLNYVDSFGLWNDEATKKDLQDVSLGKARVLLNQGKLDEFRAFTDGLRAKIKDTRFQPASLLFEGKVLEDAGRWEEAEALFARLQKDYSSSREAFDVPSLVALHYEKLGERELAQQAWEKAEGYYAEVFSRTKDNPEARDVAVNALLSVALIQARLEAPEALKTLEQLERQFPESSAAYAGWISVARVYQGAATLARRDGRAEDAKTLLAEAVDVYRKASEKHPGVPVASAAAFEGAAILSSDDVKDYDGAAKLYELVAGWFPEDPARGGAALVGAGAAYAAAGRYEDAKKALETAVERFGDRAGIAAPAMLGLARVYDKLGRWDESEVVLASLKEKYPYSSGGALYSLQIPIDRYKHWKDLDPDKAREAYDAALAEYRKVVEDYPETKLSFSAEMAEATLAFESGDKDLALDTYESLYERYGGNAQIGPAVTLRLGSFYQDNLGDEETAYKYYREVVDKFPNAREAVQAATAIVRMGRALTTQGGAVETPSAPVGD